MIGFFKSGRCVKCFDFSVDHYGHAVAIFSFVKIMGGDEYGHTFGRGTVYKLPESAARNRVDTSGGLVKKYNIRTMNRGYGKG